MKKKMRLWIISLLLLTGMCLVLTEIQTMHGLVQAEEENKSEEGKGVEEKEEERGREEEVKETEEGKEAESGEAAKEGEEEQDTEKEDRESVDRIFSEPDILYPEADGTKGYYINCPEIQIVHKEKNAVTRYELVLPDGEKKEGTLELGEEQEENELVLREAMKEGENILRVWMVENISEASTEESKEEENTVGEKEDNRELFFKELIFRLDLTAPQKVKFFYNRAETGDILLSNEPFEVFLEGKDLGSGTAEIIYSTDDGKSGSISGEKGSVMLNPGYRGKVKAYVVDHAGNKSEEVESKLIFCENILPEIQIRAEEENCVWHSNPVTVAVQVYDPPLSSGIQSFKCYCNGQVVVHKKGGMDEVTTNQMQTEFVVDLMSSGGRGIPVVVEVVDRAGNFRTESRQIYYDGSAPEIRMKGIQDNMITGHKSKAEVSIEEENLLAYRRMEVWRTAPGGGTELVTEKEEKAVDSGVDVGKAWELLMEEDGIYEINISAEDYAGNKGEKEIRIVVDRTNPVIRYVDQMQGVCISYFQWNYQADEMIEDFTEYTYEILLDGIPYTAGTRYLMEGIRHLKVKAVDAAGNESVAEAVFCIDNTSPEIRIFEVEDGKTYDKTVTMSISVDGNGEKLKEITVNEERVKLEYGSQIFRQTFDDNGEYCVRILAEDLAGNQSGKEIVFRIEKKKMTAETLVQPIRNVLTKDRKSEIRPETAEKESHNYMRAVLTVLVVISIIIGLLQWKRRRNKSA